MLLNKTRDTVLPNGESVSLQHYVDCQTTAIIYLMCCKIATCYIGENEMSISTLHLCSYLFNWKRNSQPQ